MNEPRVRKEVVSTGITVDRIYESDFQKEGTKTAQLRQIVTTEAFYPSKQISNSHQDNVFTLEEFDFSEQKFTNAENRVAWIDVPPSVTPEQVLAKIPEKSCLYRILDNKPIITDSQDFAIKNPELDLSLEAIANKQVVRYSEDHEKAGQIVPDVNGKPQYRAVFFSKLPKEDIDSRTESAEDFYATDLIRAEMSGATVIRDQNIS